MEKPKEDKSDMGLLMISSFYIVVAVYIYIYLHVYEYLVSYPSLVASLSSQCNAVCC
jgi:hypothetical protein